jgi:hypothetical protein
MLIRKQPNLLMCIKGHDGSRFHSCSGCWAGICMIECLDRKPIGQRPSVLLVGAPSVLLVGAPSIPIIFWKPGYYTHHLKHCKHCTLYTAHCTLHTIHCTLYTAHYTLHTIHCTLYTAHYTLHTIHCTLYTAHCTALHCTALHTSVRLFATNMGSA